jgi:phosphopantothenoylcysteine decarboxylase/phosphopantothenate--cysteine ligase
VLGGELPSPWGIPTVRVRSAQEMLDACQALWPKMDGVCATAAVADQRPEICNPQKTKKQDNPESLTLVATPDILATLNASKSNQWMLGFAAESQNIAQNAVDKLSKKGLDAILANDISQSKGFGECANSLLPITKDGPGGALGPLPKGELAREAVRWFAGRLDG